ncbi:hypothetical protein HanRHA438_Chr09g0381261 [Helianthus annuus]|nr:hypothetical protein HanHA89_Chr09g0323991 [Helianthus annuus]KAJ0886595.1 hypothetical protein HanRHA438_Chr09g0381261 [Helianthus annuus]
MGRGSGRRFVWISTKHRGVLSLWRDFFELTEVGRLTLDWFSILVGDYIDSTEIRGWRKTGRPKQVNDPSFTELKTIRCIIHGPLSEDIYNFTEMSKSSISSLFEVGMEAGRESEIADEEMDAVADARTFFSGFLLDRTPNKLLDVGSSAKEWSGGKSTDSQDPPCSSAYGVYIYF